LNSALQNFLGADQPPPARGKTGAQLGGRETQVGPLGRAGEIEIEVVELTGKPGDVWLMDMRVLHTVAPNARSTPRVMLTQRFAPRFAFVQIVAGSTLEKPRPAAP
jgi:ectoine hydroxylase-related dioxygenase (phytanoyl-CoA dioxygenase family)